MVVDEAKAEEFFEQYCDVSGEILNRNVKYITLCQKSIELFNKIASLLGENKRLLYEYEDTESALAAMLEEQAYKSGLADGARLR
ncbi:MAG: hypothetical protein ACPLRU_03375 [Desulfofundulus sp.]